MQQPQKLNNKATVSKSRNTFIIQSNHKNNTKTAGDQLLLAACSSLKQIKLQSCAVIHVKLKERKN